jgi:hypothetical protein
MHSRKRSEQVDEIIVIEGAETEQVTVKGYQQLNDKCDVVISKINKRKNKKLNK